MKRFAWLLLGLIFVAPPAQAKERLPNFLVILPDAVPYRP